MGKKRTAGKAGAESSAKITFEQALGKLEQIVASLEDGKLGLDESLSQYEMGVKYMQQCYRRLEEAEQRIELLSGTDASGAAQAEPFDERQMSLEEKQAARSHRRSRGGPPGAAEEKRGEDEGGENPAMDGGATLF